ncbi:MAG: phage holin family protein [Burkholderiales bacterium]|nr:phage holin family protein [Burkholderiales bacterium]
MNHAITSALLALYMLLPVGAHAQDIRAPLSYSLREYGVILGISLLGGFARWYMAVRRGDANMLSFTALVGELAVSAFAGLITFWACESFNMSPLITAAAAGLAGHAGGSGIAWMERMAKRSVAKRFGITEPAELRKADGSST